jgi:transcriptional regulator with XRE-family HTH domain
MMVDMTETPFAGIPPLTRGWRMKMALDYGDIGALEMADELGVSRQTVARWMNIDGVPIRPAFLKQWALRCGVDYSWLATGVPSDEASAPNPGTTSTNAGTTRRYDHENPEGFLTIWPLPSRRWAIRINEAS